MGELPYHTDMKSANFDTSRPKNTGISNLLKDKDVCQSVQAVISLANLLELSDDSVGT